jgi:outer membrane immunogenic protein
MTQNMGLGHKHVRKHVREHWGGVMRRTLAFASAIIGVVIGGSALAADLPPSPPRAPVAYVPAVLPVYNWAGVYIGINGGWGWGNAKFTANTTTPVGVIQGSPNDNGGVVGGTLGVNWQASAFVFGVEGDWDYSAINTGTSATICTFSGTCQTGNNWLATLRGRLGYAADRVLFYATGGGAFANVQTVFNGVTTSHNQAGWTAGAGLEWAFADNWTAKIEYLYVNLGNGTVNCINAVCTGLAGGNPLPVSVSLTENLFRAGVTSSSTSNRQPRESARDVCSHCQRKTFNARLWARRSRPAWCFRLDGGGRSAPRARAIAPQVQEASGALHNRPRSGRFDSI